MSDVKDDVQKDWDDLRVELVDRFGDNAKALALAEVMTLRMIALGAKPSSKNA